MNTSYAETARWERDKRLNPKSQQDKLIAHKPEYKQGALGPLLSRVSLFSSHRENCRHLKKHSQASSLSNTKILLLYTNSKKQPETQLVITVKSLSSENLLYRLKTPEKRQREVFERWTLTWNPNKKHLND